MKINASEARFKRKRLRASASDAAVPITVAIVVDSSATARLVRSEAISSVSFQAREYHFQVKPDQTAL
ncbi:MAG TPA: hypothetical protein VFV34_09615 [Blastocatellia bacterium]|nr:hypothetical protein [Blastocatellia bacterium]